MSEEIGFFLKTAKGQSENKERKISVIPSVQDTGLGEYCNFPFNVDGAELFYSFSTATLYSMFQQYAEEARLYMLQNKKQ